MDVDDLGITQIDTTPPPLELTPAEIEALADELMVYHSEFADLYYRLEQAHLGYMYVQELMAPIESKAIQPMAMALKGGNVQAMQQFDGQGRWPDEKLLKKHWRLVNVAYLNIRGTFYYSRSDVYDLCSILDGYSRCIVHWDIREAMTEDDVEVIIQRAREKFPGARPRVISDNGPQFVAKDFKAFLCMCGMTHVRTSPFYP